MNIKTKTLAANSIACTGESSSTTPTEAFLWGYNGFI